MGLGYLNFNISVNIHIAFLIKRNFISIHLSEILLTMCRYCNIVQRIKQYTEQRGMMFIIGVPTLQISCHAMLPAWANLKWASFFTSWHISSKPHILKTVFKVLGLQDCQYLGSKDHRNKVSQFVFQDLWKATLSKGATWAVSSVAINEYTLRLNC